MNYRKATSKDLGSLSELFDAYRMFYHKSTDLEGAKTFLEERISNKDSEIFIAETIENEIVGFV